MIHLGDEMIQLSGMLKAQWLWREQCTSALGDAAPPAML